MTRRVSALAVCLIASAAIGAGQQQTPPSTSREISLTGCLVQGSHPGMFILDHAMPANGSTRTAFPRYLVQAEAPDMDLLSVIDRQVTVRGTASDPIPPVENQRDEMSLPRLRAQELTVLSATCAAPQAAVPSAGGPAQPQIQDPQQIQDPPRPPEVTVSGCLTTGESGSYLLVSAVPEAGITGNNLRFRLVAGADDIDFKARLNQVVRVSGPTDGTIPPNRPRQESELPTIFVHTLSSIASECL